MEATGATVERVLFVAGDLPWPPDGGGRIATLRVLEAMAEIGEVDLIALADPAVNVDPGRLASLCRRVEVVEMPFTFGRHRTRQALLAGMSVLSTSPYRLRKFHNRHVRDLIDLRLQTDTYSLTHFDHFGVAPYQQTVAPATLTTQNVESEIYRLAGARKGGALRGAWARLESSKLRRIEPALYYRFDHVFTLSDLDGSALRRQGVHRTSVFPVPVDAPDSRPEPEPPGPTLLTLGSMSWFGVEDGLMWFHDHVWPTVQEAVPGVRWALAGPNAGPRIRSLSIDPAISVLGYLPDIDAVVARSRVCLVPLHIAGGIRIKLLELLAHGRPCVATSIGAQGIDFPDGHGCFRRDNPTDFARAVVDLLRDDDLWRRTGALGWEYVSQRHTRAAALLAVQDGIESARRHHREIRAR